MANHRAISAVSTALREVLRQRYAASAAALSLPACGFDVISSARLANPTATFDETTLFLYLHRITVNQQLRPMRGQGSAGPLGLDLHYLLIMWGKEGETAEAEQELFAWALREFHAQGRLDVNWLNGNAGWEMDEMVTLQPADLGGEDLMRIWDAVNRPYRLSCGWIGRVVRLTETSETGLPVVAKRFTFSDEVEGKGDAT